MARSPKRAGARSIEQRFDAAIDSADQLAWFEDIASAPNHVGSPHEKANADAILAKFKSWGWDARIETFMVLYPTPLSTTIEPSSTPTAMGAAFSPRQGATSSSIS